MLALFEKKRMEQPTQAVFARQPDLPGVSVALNGRLKKDFSVAGAAG
jgi:hypothetical protein